MVPAAGVDSLMSSMEELDPDREKEPSLMELVRGPLSDSITALERRNLELPTGQDFHFYNNFQEFKRPVANIQNRVTTLLSQLGSLKDVIHHPAAFPADVDEGYDWLVGMQDAVLERVDASLDKFYLERKAESKQRPGASSKQNASLKSPPAVANEGAKSGDVKVAKGKDKLRSPIPFHIPSIPRPQDKFDDAVDNSNTPFRHKALKGRVSMESAAATSRERGPDSGDSVVVSTLSVIEEYARKLGHKDPADNIHPLEEELTKMAYVEGLVDTVEVRKYESLDDTPLTLVTTPKALKEMAVKLRTAGELAIDLENHHYRSYQGFVCLMQVSTRDEDFIVDSLDLRSEIGPCLGDIFADPAIKKVMHGADRDIVWLQRDFGIYVCNLFDTGQAARVLQLPGFGLGFLLEHFCGVHADKRYQLADWRIRPLPTEMTKYAREDTHYLLYVHDMLKQLLLDARSNRKAEEDDPFLQVYKRSRDLCLQLYAKEIFTETSYQHLYGLQEKKFRPEQTAVLAALYSWRDAMARKEDESTGFVLPNHLLLQLGSEAPDDVRQLQSFVKGSHSFVSRHASAVVEIIREAKEKALKEQQEAHPELEEGEVRVASPREELVVGDMISVGHSGQRKDTVLEDEEGKVETGFSSDTLQTDRVVTIEASLRMPGPGTPAPEATGTGDSPTDTRPGEGLAKLKSEVLTRPAVVSRRTSSSLFGRKPPKSPLPPSNVPDFGGTSEYSPAAPLTGPGLPAGSFPDGVDQVMSAPFTVDDGDGGASDEVQETTTASEENLTAPFPMDDGDGGASDVAQKTSVSEGSLIASTVATSLEMQPDGPESALPVDAVDNSELTRREGRSPEISTASVDNLVIPASAVVHKKSERSPIIEAKRKPSKLGSLLGGRKRVHQTIPSESANDVEQARIKTLDIESSMVLPFGHSVLVLPDTSLYVQQQQTSAEEEVHAVAIPEEQLGDHNRTLHEETAGQFEQEAPERPAVSSSDPDFIMFEPEAGEASRSLGSDSSKSEKGGREKPRKHRTWWPSAADESDMAPHAPRHQDKPDGDKHLEVPMSLSEMHRNSKRGKKSRRHSEVSFDEIDPQVPPARDFGSSSRNKKRRNDPSVAPQVGARVQRVASPENKAELKSFSYSEARGALGLENLYAEKADDAQGARGRGRGRGPNKKSSSRPGIPLSKTAFDPLRRAREEPRPEGIRPGQRRQVFPQTGNRTAVFK